MSDQNQVATQDNALAAYQQAAGLVRQYAEKLVSNERATEFATTLSLLARQEPKFLQCKPESIVSAMMACVQLDLMPNTPEQLAFLIPYKVGGVYVCNFQVGYKGLLKLAYNSGEVKSIAVELVFKGDKFKLKLGTARQLIHEPDLNIDRTNFDLVEGGYATVKLKNDEKAFHYLGRAEIDKVRNFALSKAYDASNKSLPWNAWPEAQAKKTILKPFMRLLPNSSKDNKLVLAAQFDSWAEAQRLKFDGGQLIEAETESAEDAEKARKERIEKADIARQELLDSNFQAVPVEPVTSDQSNG